ncbi:transmembrane protein 134 isoform X3 [Meles meles]|uniref:transmembrane protein 134 isoform X3 n=1 Tax=Meles meles TaxID=9662 RepID=UPI001E69CBE8|nr:transmembrane protein 134 isoform X3 [Meles meles]
MSAARPQFSIDDAFELSLEDAGPGPEFSGVARFGPLHFERRARFEVADEDKQSRLRYQNLENDEDGAQASPEPDGGVSTRDSSRTSIRSSQWSFSTISNTTQRSYHACCSWTQHPLIQKNRRVVLASFLLLLLGLGSRRVTRSAIYSLSAWSQVQRRLISPLMEVTQQELERHASSEWAGPPALSQGEHSCPFLPARSPQQSLWSQLTSSF